MSKVGIVTTFEQPCGLAVYASRLIRNFVQDNLVILAEDAPIHEIHNDVTAPRYRCWKRYSGDYSALLQVIEREEIGLVHFNVQYMFFYPDVIAAALAELRRRGIKVLTHLHATGGIALGVKAFAEASDALVVHLIENRMNLVANGAMPHRVHVIPHGVTVEARRDRREARRRLGIPESRRFILTFGFVRPHKGILETIDAVSVFAQNNAELHYYVVGNTHEDDRGKSDFLAKIREHKDALGVGDRVHLVTDFVPYDTLVDYVFASDIVVLNYQGNCYEASGALALALGCDADVVASSAPMFSDSEDTVIRITDALPLPIALSVVFQQEWTRQALQAHRQKWVTRRSWQETAKKFASLYEAISGIRVCCKEAC